MNLGHLYVVHTQQTKPPKNKLAICVCSESNWFLWINTLPRFHGVGQMPLVETDHDALTHGCFLDCSQLKTFPVAERSISIDRGILCEELCDRIVEFLINENPKTLTPDHQAKIISNLNTLY